MDENSKKLTSHFDLHETFAAILKEEYLEEDVKEDISQGGISLFRPVPNDRTCEEAGIPTDFCACSLQIPTNSKSQLISQKIGNITVVYINKIIFLYKYCAKFSLAKVLDVKSVFTHKNVDFFTYTVIFQTTPGNGIFKATVNCEDCTSDNYFDFVITDIRRLNTNQQNHCVNDLKENRKLKMFCHCRNKI